MCLTNSVLLVHLLLISLLGCCAFIEQYFYNGTVFKCCQANEFLTFNNQNLRFECVHNDNKLLHVLNKNILPSLHKDLSKEISCVDIFENEMVLNLVAFNGSFHYSETLQLTPFPKCCPLNNIYDANNHMCNSLINNTDIVYNNSITSEMLKLNLNNGFAVLKVGMAECANLLVDYKFSSLNRVHLHNNRDLTVMDINKTVAFGNYCLDNIHNSKDYIIRVCHHNFDICKKNKNDKRNLRCIRKCCPDGYMYKESKECQYDFQHGLSFSSEGSVNGSYSRTLITNNTIASFRFICCGTRAFLLALFGQ